jgi:hypothetical protein
MGRAVTSVRAPTKTAGITNAQMVRTQVKFRCSRQAKTPQTASDIILFFSSSVLCFISDSFVFLMDGFGEVSFLQTSGGSLQDLAAKLQRDYLVLFVDCCNSFDPYRLYRASESADSLLRVHVARPFTLYQLRELVLNKLERMIQELGARVVLVSGVGFYCLDDSFDKGEWTVIWAEVFDRLKVLSRDYNLLTLVSDGGAFDGSDCDDCLDAHN